MGDSPKGRTGRHTKANVSFTLMDSDEAEKTLIGTIAATLRLEARLNEDQRVRDTAATMLIKLGRNDGLASSEINARDGASR
jgi:hypothetical protein